MRWLLWVAGLVVLAVICFAAYRAFSSPGFYMTLTASIVAAVLPFFLKRKSPEGEAADHQIVREGGTPHVEMPGPKPIKRKPTGKVTVK